MEKPVFDPNNYPLSESLRVNLEKAISIHHVTRDADLKAMKEAGKAISQYEQEYARPDWSEANGRLAREWNAQHKQALEPLREHFINARVHLNEQRAAAKKALFATPEGKEQFSTYFDAELADMAKWHCENTINDLRVFSGDVPAFLERFGLDTDFLSRGVALREIEYPKAVSGGKYLLDTIGRQAAELAQLEGQPLEEMVRQRLQTLGASEQATKIFTRFARHIEAGTFQKFEETAYRLSGRIMEERETQAIAKRAAKPEPPPPAADPPPECPVIAETPVVEEAAENWLKRLGKEKWMGKKGLAVAGGTVTLGVAAYGLSRLFRDKPEQGNEQVR